MYGSDSEQFVRLLSSIARTNGPQSASMDPAYSRMASAFLSTTAVMVQGLPSGSNLVLSSWMKNLRRSYDELAFSQTPTIYFRKR